MAERTALGLIETRGLVAAIEGADAATKAAQVRLRGYELVSGGIVTLRLTGQVAEVKAAVDAGAAAAGRVGTLLASHVIPLLGEGVEEILDGGRGAAPEVPPGRGAEHSRVAGQTAAPAREALEGMRLRELRDMARAQGVLNAREIARSRKSHLIDRMIEGAEPRNGD